MSGKKARDLEDTSGFWYRCRLCGTRRGVAQVLRVRTGPRRTENQIFCPGRCTKMVEGLK